MEEFKITSVQLYVSLGVKYGFEEWIKSRLEYHKKHFNLKENKDYIIKNGSHIFTRDSANEFYLREKELDKQIMSRSQNSDLGAKLKKVKKPKPRKTKKIKVQNKVYEPRIDPHVVNTIKKHFEPGEKGFTAAQVMQICGIEMRVMVFSKTLIKVFGRPTHMTYNDKQGKYYFLCQKNEEKNRQKP